MDVSLVVGCNAVQLVSVIHLQRQLHSLQQATEGFQHSGTNLKQGEGQQELTIMPKLSGLSQACKQQYTLCLFCLLPHPHDP